MAEREVSQTKNVVSGDQAAGDINKNKIAFNYGYQPGARSEITALIEKFRTERGGDVKFEATIKKLEHFQSQAPDEPVLTLEEKLEKGGCLDQLRFAQRTKELFSKKLVEFQYSESAQRIHALLLAEVYSRFHRLVAPLIYQGADINAINHAVQVDIIDPVRCMLEDNVLELYSDEINGMLFFLTGNCHIRWDKC